MADYYDTPDNQYLPSDDVQFTPQSIPSPYAPVIPLQTAQEIPTTQEPVQPVQPLVMPNIGNMQYPQQSLSIITPKPVSDLSDLQKPVDDSANEFNDKYLHLINTKFPAANLEQSKKELQDLANTDYKNFATRDRARLSSNKLSPQNVADYFDQDSDISDQEANQAKNFNVPVFDRTFENGQVVTTSRDLPILDAINESRKKLGDYYSRIENTQIKADYWKNAGTWQKIMAGIGLALSGLGGPQSAANAVGIINSAIDRDIKLQIQDLEKTKFAAQGQEKELGTLYKMYGDMNLAVKAKQMLDLQRAINKMQMMIQAGKLSNPEALASLARLRMQMEKHAEEMDGYARERAARNIEKQATLNTAKVLTKEEKAKLKPEQKARIVEGFGGLANSAEEAKAMNKRIIPMQATLHDFDTLISATYNKVLSGQTWRKHFGTANASIKKAAATLRGLNREDFVGSGVISQQDWDVLNSVFRDPTAIFSLDSNNREALLRVRSGIIQRTLDQAKAYGLGTAPSFLYKQPPTTWDEKYFKTGR